MQELLQQIATAIDSESKLGQVADYIPALGQVNPEQWGLSVCTVDGQTFSVGDASVPFSIQSISKVFGLTLAMQLEGEELWQRVGFEPSGLPFNSLVQLEHERGIPRNPFINAGAIVVTDVICSRYASPNLVMTDMARKLSGNNAVAADQTVAESELAHGSRNAAMAYLMKAFGNFDNDVEFVLKAYFSNCALTMSCEDLANSMSYLANNGFHSKTGQQILSPGQTRQVNALMATSGLYDEAGRFAFRVGMPGKSGVGGGIVAIVPGKLTICVWSPRLNEAGNSHAGMKTLELLSRELGWSVY